MRPSTLVRSSDSIEFVIPGATFRAASYCKNKHFLLVTGKSTPDSKLLDKEYCKRTGEELYSYLIQHTPAGVFKELAKQIIGGDITCDCYTAELLGMDKQDVFRKAQDVRMGKPVPEKICTKCLITKPLTEFYKTKIPVKSGGVTSSVQSNCIKCTLAQQAKRRNAEKGVIK